MLEQAYTVPCTWQGALGLIHLNHLRACAALTHVCPLSTIKKCRKVIRYVPIPLISPTSLNMLKFRLYYSRFYFLILPSNQTSKWP